MATKKEGETKDCHKDKADHSAVCIWKPGQKRGQNAQKMAARRQSSLEKYYELGPTAALPPVAQGHLDSAQAVLCELIDQVGWQEVSSIGTQEDVLSRSNLFCPRCSRFGPRGRLECINSGAN